MQPWMPRPGHRGLAYEVPTGILQEITTAPSLLEGRASRRTLQIWLVLHSLLSFLSENLRVVGS